MISSIKRLFIKRSHSSDVARYYDEYTADYLSVGGDVIQAFRPTDTSQLLDYLLRSIGLQDGMKILDAGCGVAGPAIYFAQNAEVQIEGITVSPVQTKIANDKIAAAGLSDRVRVRTGDYCKIESLHSANSFDGVIFIESLGHAPNPAAPIVSAFNALKQGGFIYIKDYYRRMSCSLSEQLDIDEVVENINDNYCYNTLELNEVVSCLRRTGFEILWIKKPDIASDFSWTEAFEQRVNINTFTKPIPAVDWLEIKCMKP